MFWVKQKIIFIFSFLKSFSVYIVGRGKELIRFDDLDFIFKVTFALRNAKFRLN